VILTMHSAEPFVLEALEQGASAYVLKDAGVAELVRAIRETVKGRRYLSPPLSDKAVAAYTPTGTAAKTRNDPYERLTLRERQVLHLAAEGLRNTAVAERLGISVRTGDAPRPRAGQARPAEPDRARPLGPQPGSRHARRRPGAAPRVKPRRSAGAGMRIPAAKST
jgi:FixJ family two-component response regulator